MKNQGTENWIFEKLNKIDNPSYKLTKTWRDNMQSNKIRNEKCNITTNREKNQENSKAVL